MWTSARHGICSKRTAFGKLFWNMSDPQAATSQMLLAVDEGNIWAATWEKPFMSILSSLTQTRLYSHWRWLEAWNFGFRKKRYCTIQAAKTKALSTDLRLSFRVCKSLVFSRRGSFSLKGINSTVQCLLKLMSADSAICSRIQRTDINLCRRL